ncbi:right-handed parallel beta-helix repeat-containing protein [Priestia megaterium]|uniref:right-handed parallel beta-helix repeat-containing protein n=1 Tax=Priestia megaterium TaxID=1404 RepID=UPI0015D4CE10|nr:right-handed parallel beta-helix repeat-containing protein [Priestia megaterium]
MKQVMDEVNTLKGKGLYLKTDDYPRIIPEASDSPRIQRLYDDIGAKGKTVVFIKGTYVLDRFVSITNKHKFSIIGHKDAVIKRAPLYTGDLMRIVESSGSMVRELQVNSDDGFGTPAKIVGSYNADSKTYNVNSTEGYNSKGNLYIYTQAGIQSVNYSGKTETAFTGCTNYGVIGGGGLTSPVITDSEVRPVYGSPLRLIGVTDFDITQCTFEGNFNHAGSDMVSIESIGTTTTTAQGYKLYDVIVPSENGRIYQNNFKNSGEEAVIFRHGCSDIWVNNNEFDTIWGTGVTNKGQRSQVNYNTFKNCYIGTEVNAEAEILTQGNEGTVKGNRFFNCNIDVFMQTTGLSLEKAGKYVETYIIEDNKMHDSKFCSIYGRHGTEAIIKNNTIKRVKVVDDPRKLPQGAGNGIYLFNVHSSIVEGNRIYDTENEQVLIENCHHIEVLNNCTRVGGVFTRTTGEFKAGATEFVVKTTSGYADSGVFKVSINGIEQTITYTGKTALAFTGCTGGDGTVVPEGSFIRDDGKKRHISLISCSNYEFANNRIMNGYSAIHSCGHGEIYDNKVVNVESAAGILLTGSSNKNNVKRNRVEYAQQYGIRLNGLGSTQKSNKVQDNDILYPSVSASGGYPAIQVLDNIYANVSRNESFTDLANKPNYVVEMGLSTSNSYGLDNIGVGYTGDTTIKDGNTVSPNTIRSA